MTKTTDPTEEAAKLAAAFVRLSAPFRRRQIAGTVGEAWVQS